MKKLALAWTPNKIKKNDLKQDVYECVNETAQEFYTKGIKTKKVFNKGSVGVWKETNGVDQNFFLSHTESLLPVGMLSISKNSYKYLSVGMSWIHEEHQGNGYGFLLYETALKQNGHLASSEDLSIGSSSLWKKLWGKYNVCLMVNFEDKWVEVKIVGWEVVSKITYPIVLNRDGKRISLRTRQDGRLSIDERTGAKYSFYLARI